ncbi:hypothetical protein [Bacillus cereus]|uniref:hypothetical protein n=1 Tax=Bacillus cereus TaxID=1396 RepID=UPI000BF99BD2|nr:hypothetical protein [Bacillus cereus]PEX67032.1 hypothetical protein CN460_24935 [Bacillus cereus]
MKLFLPPQINPINKDAVIDDLKRRLAATEFQHDHYEHLYWESNREAYKYRCELNSKKALDSK